MQYDFPISAGRPPGSRCAEGNKGLKLSLVIFSRSHSEFRINFRCFELGTHLGEVCWEGKRMRIIYKKPPVEERALLTKYPLEESHSFVKICPGLRCGSSWSLLTSWAWCTGRELRVNTAGLVGLGQYDHSLREGPSLRQCTTTLSLGGGSSFALDNADLCPGPGPKQVCLSMV